MSEKDRELVDKIMRKSKRKHDSDSEEENEASYKEKLVRSNEKQSI